MKHQVLYLIRKSKGRGYFSFDDYQASLKKNKYKDGEDDLISANFFAVTYIENESERFDEISAKPRYEIKAVHKPSETWHEEVYILEYVRTGNETENTKFDVYVVKTPFGDYYFKLIGIAISNYKGKLFRKSIKEMYAVEPLHDRDLDELCRKHHFFFVGE